MGLLCGVVPRDALGAAGENGRLDQHAPASRPETQPATSPAEAPLQVVAFYSSTCYNCEKMRKTLKACQDRWPKRIRVEHRDIRDVTLHVQMIDYNKHYEASAQAPPKVFVGEQYLEDYPAIFKRLQTVIAEELAKGTTTFQPPPNVSVDQEGGLTKKEIARAKLLRYFETFGPGAVAGAGLLDGVNPCAFTTIVFLLSMLTHLGKSRRELAVVGVCFTLAIFLTYLLLGLGAWGALETIKAYSVGSGISAILTCGVAVLTLALGVWSFIDFMRYRRSGDVKAVTLGLPMSVKQRIHKVIRVGLTARGLAVGAFMIGVLVAVLESVCTGQIYLPTIVLVLEAPGLQANAVAYLLLYNVMFIVPLVAILVIAYFGVGSERLGGFLRRRLGVLKLAMAALFISLGVLLLLTL